MNNRDQLVLWPDQRLTHQSSVDLALESLNVWGRDYKHWVIAYSGGKDSTALTTFTVWAVRQGLVPRPETLTVLYADTRQELPPLNRTAFALMDTLRGDGVDCRVVLPALDDRFYVYMLGRGVPPPKNRFRWCTPQLKIEPMQQALADLRQQYGEKFLMLTGVRLGESAARDQRISISCSKDSGECGTGWMQVATPDAVADTLAPIIHWRLCHVWDWLYGFPVGDAANPYWKITNQVAAVYGEEDARTGCIGCNLVDHDTALDNLLKTDEWAHLRPLKEIKPIFKELIRPTNRLRKAGPEILKDGRLSKSAQRLGPITMAAREWALAKLLDIQDRARVNLLDPEEIARIRELMALNTWPEGWAGDEITGDVQLPRITTTSDQTGYVVQHLLGS